MLRSKLRFKAGIFACGVSIFAVGALAQVALPDIVETANFSTDAFSTGTLDRTSGALPATLWRGADAQTLEFLLTQLPVRPATPSLGEAMKRTLLSPGAAPVGAAPSLGGKKLAALARAGFVEEARTVASLSTAGRNDPWTGRADAIASLLDGNIGSACRRNENLSSGRDDLFWVKLRVLCYAEAGEGDAADLTLGVLREQGALSEADEAFLAAAAAGATPKILPAPENALHYAIARRLDLPVAPDLLKRADGGVLAAVAHNAKLTPATRIAAAQRAIASGVMAPAYLSGLMANTEFDVAEIGNAAAAARTRSADPLTDAILYQSVRAMSAPEFLRDKAQRIALALSLGDSFHRAYALSVLYADDIAALEGALLSPDEAASFALARMAVGDSVGAGEWLAAMIGVNASVSALPEAQALAFIERVNLLALLDPQTAARIARSADVSLINRTPAYGPSAHAHSDPAVIARIVEAAFDAALDGKTGQAGLAALAASNGAAEGGEIESVVISQSLRAAELGDLQRRYAFESGWAATFDASPVLGGAIETTEIAEHADDGPAPRIKPRASQ